MERGYPGHLSVAALVAISILIVSFTPVVTADATDHYAYSGAVDSPYSNSGSTTVAYSHDGTFAAVGFHRNVAILDIASRNYTRSIDVGDGILSIAFSEDDSIMFVGIESLILESIAVALYNTDNWQRIGVVDEGFEVNSISTLESEQMFAAANEDKGANEYPYDDPAHASSTYEGVHTSKVTCIDYAPSGNHLLTGSADGSIVVWNRLDQTAHLSWLSDDPIEDCSFSPQGDTVTWATGAVLQVRSMPSGEFLHTISLNGPAKQIQWNLDGDELWVLSEISSPVIQVFNSLQMNIINSYDIGHDAAYFALSPSGDEFIVGTFRSIITVFTEQPWRPGYGQPGLDGDMDGIPNNLDSDDDGDGIGDEYEYVCNEGNNCDSHPNMNFIRAVRISFAGSTMTIQDTVQLNSSQSAPLRDLASSSVVQDRLVDSGEAIRMERMLCGGTNEQQIIDDWLLAVGLELTAIVSHNVICDAKLGLIDTENTDSKTRISIRWFIEMELSNQVPRPFNLTFTPGISAPASTVAMATPTTPIKLTVLYEGKTEYVSGAIYPNDSMFTIHIAAEALPQPTIVEISMAWLAENYWIPIVITIFVPLTIIAVIRRRNVVRFEDDKPKEKIVAKRRKSRIATEEYLEEVFSTSGRRQPSAPPTVEKSRPQPSRPPPDKRAVRKVRKSPGTTIQTGEAPEGESWDYEKHGAYWDADDPDQQDPYGEAKEFHESDMDLKQLAEQMGGDDESNNQPDDGGENIEFADALSKLTEGGIEIEPEPDASPDPDEPKPKKRRAPKRRTPKRRTKKD